ncbi:MAG TPA: transcriptional regulator [Amycolatopsis sp.]|nr:transcriptional regulator [Amycolatopsis sp.]
MYFYIRRAHRPVTRDEAAASVGISRKLAAFHLDKLVDAGLLRADYEPVGGARRVGRAPKVYRPADVEIRVAIPARSRDLLSEILLEGVLGERDGERATESVVRAARALGESLAPGACDLGTAERMLARHGFEPYRAEGPCVRMRNCPFHPLAERAPDLVCGLNHAFLTGYAEGSGMRVVASPRAGECCVQLCPSPTHTFGGS